MRMTAACSASSSSTFMPLAASGRLRRSRAMPSGSYDSNTGPAPITSSVMSGSLAFGERGDPAACRIASHVLDDGVQLHCQTVGLRHGQAPTHQPLDLAEGGPVLLGQARHERVDAVGEFLGFETAISQAPLRGLPPGDPFAGQDVSEGALSAD